jgi:hypothetical protein
LSAPARATLQTPDFDHRLPMRSTAAAHSPRERSLQAPPRWLPEGKSAAVCFSVDDVHPSTSADAYEAGGDLKAGALGRIAELQRRHSKLQVTLCVTPNWRLESLTPFPVVRYLPWLRRRLHWTRLAPPDRFRIDRHPGFVDYLNGLQRTEIVLHGLHHAHRGPLFATEFQDETESQCRDAIEQGVAIFNAAGLRFTRGYVPPAWNAPPARAAMSGLTGVSLIYPELLTGSELVHLTCNFQATSPPERAMEILRLGGVLHVKAHIFKAGGGHVMLDGLDELYANYLDALFGALENEFGSRLWWTTLSEVASAYRHSASSPR